MLFPYGDSEQSEVAQFGANWGCLGGRNSPKHPHPPPNCVSPEVTFPHAAARVKPHLHAHSIYFGPLDANEPDNSHSQAATAPGAGSTMRYSFHEPGDQDWVRFYARASDRYTIATSALDMPTRPTKTGAATTTP